MAMQVKDLTIDQLKTIIRETVQDSLAVLVKELKTNSSRVRTSTEARAIDRLSDIDVQGYFILNSFFNTSRP